MHFSFRFLVLQNPSWTYHLFWVFPWRFPLSPNLALLKAKVPTVKTTTGPSLLLPEQAEETEVALHCIVQNGNMILFYKHHIICQSYPFGVKKDGTISCSPPLPPSMNMTLKTITSPVWPTSCYYVRTRPSLQTGNISPWSCSFRLCVLACQLNCVIVWAMAHQGP